MNTLREQAAQAKADGERQLALAGKLEEAADLADQVGGIATATATTGKRRGRKKGSKNKTPATAASKSTTAGSGRGKRNGPKSMKEVVVSVLKGKKKGLQLSDIVTAVIGSGYKTNSKQPVNVVYQAVYKLMKDKGVPVDQVIEKEGDKYRLKSAA